MKNSSRGLAWWTAARTGLLFVRDTSLWILLSGVILALSGPVPEPRLALLCVFAAGVLAALCAELSAGSSAGRMRWLTQRIYMSGLLPLIPLVLQIRSVTSAMILLPPVIYLCLCIVRGQLIPDTSRMPDRYPLMLGTVLAAGLLLHTEKITWGLPLAFFTAAIMIFLMRMLRLEESGAINGAAIAVNLVLPLLLAAAAWILRSDAVLHLGGVLLRFLRTFLLGPIVYLFAIAMGAILWLIATLIGLLRGQGGETYDAAAMITQIAPLAEMEGASTGPGGLTVMIFRILGGLLFLAAALLLFRTLYGTRRKVSEDTAPGAPVTRSILRPDPESASEERLHLTDRSPRARVRRAYASFYRQKKRAGSVEPGYTSAEIGQLLVSPEDRPEADQLRRLYLRARYTGDGALTTEEAREAERLARKLNR